MQDKNLAKARRLHRSHETLPDQETHFCHTQHLQMLFFLNFFKKLSHSTAYIGMINANSQPLVSLIHIFFMGTFHIVQKYDAVHPPFRVLATQSRNWPSAPCEKVKRAQSSFVGGEQKHEYVHIMQTHNTRLKKIKKVTATRTQNTHALLGSIAAHFTTLPGPHFYLRIRNLQIR